MLRNEDFPEPTCPTIPKNDPIFRFKEILCRTGFAGGVMSQKAETFSNSTELAGVRGGIISGLFTEF